MGVMSRRVVPVCGNLCFFCPSMRARSRHPVKRYKKLLTELFPRNQDAEPNDRKIVKLCEYSLKNPLRIPKITDQLEQRCYKDLRNENFGSVKVVACIYKKLLSSCKGHTPLFASSLLGIVRTLLEQTQQDEMQILACSILIDFINGQMDSTYMFNLEGLIPKLCQLAQEVGDDERALRLRAAGMQALANMVWFMGEQSHISMDFDNIISVILENYLDLQMKPEDGKEARQRSQSQDQWVQGVLKEEPHGSSFPDMSKRVSSLRNPVTKPDLYSTTDTSKCSSYWSKVCLNNIARLAKEATTVRRVLEPLFHHFDVENHWSSDTGVACSVILFLQSLLEESGENSHLLLSILIKHLDHKNVAKKPNVQIHIVDIATQLTQNAKLWASVAIIGAITDLIKQLRKCLQNAAELSNSVDSMVKWNADLQYALENCISQLSKKVGDAGPILDMMSGLLENISNNTVIARTTISAVHRTAQIVSSIPNISYHKKAFPDALFHQLLLAMAHPDHETRVGAHSVFSVVLMPSLVSPWSDLGKDTSQAVSGILPSASWKVRSGSFSFQDESKEKEELMDGGLQEESRVPDVDVKHSHSHSYSFKRALTDGKTITSFRLSSHQVSLLLSSIWVQATSAENNPANFEAMAHTYNIALLFTRFKTSSHMALVRCFQLAFSLRSISLDQEGGLQPSCRRSLFTLASYMLIFSARAGNLLELIPIVKSSLTEQTVDPFLELVEDIRLQAVYAESGKMKIAYGSEEDEVCALKSLSAIELNDHQLKEIVISQIMTKFAKLPEDELSGMKEQLFEGFSLDDAYPLGAPLFMETPQPCSPLARMELQAFDEVMPLAVLTDEEAFTEAFGSQSDRKTSLSINSHDVLSVDELLESVLKSAQQVASLPVSSTPIPYDQMKTQCEALVAGKQQKMSVLKSFKHQQETKEIVVSSEFGGHNSPTFPNMNVGLPEGNLKLINKDQVQARDELALCSHEFGRYSLRLPPSSPYDKFLKAAGC
ncbi:protein SEMI-ROLLED LEAF 2-like isoform X1 [Mangifera indica]|uniref:protein SEMI-ROLLED LEAF 2-like isoform X1 n=1 Tax=Mangifera indica TaxID=29780 RepID=UPI001CFA4B23|nr:protein SEMI-ROLLED LEAF 2-like isoform X1 [Mangifera indica]XP_044466328.1 protein SEMI-ROLLED LEAF 2-like isoform X2 [Mangifera indica]XP_044466329.1 protein SEMI-ROLLED LEAF 2-like isoform X1 [Mangifera indica]XP_044466330.1 protein SEMI-ROLLED LEAF 2-like isoform X1 [Mangifera indica]